MNEVQRDNFALALVAVAIGIIVLGLMVASGWGDPAYPPCPKDRPAHETCVP